MGSHDIKPACVQCRFCSVPSGLVPGVAHYCRHPSNEIDHIVKGRQRILVDCEEMRVNRCGSDGRLFEPKLLKRISDAIRSVFTKAKSND